MGIGMYIKITVLLVIVVASILAYEKVRSWVSPFVAEPANSPEIISKTYSQIIEITGVDEWVLAQLVSQESLSKQDFRKLLGGLVVGETEAEVSAVATFKYYCKLSEVRVDYKDRALMIYVPHLKLSLPVAFDSETMSEQGNASLFGKGRNELVNEVRQEFSKRLEDKGMQMRTTVYHKAAQFVAQVIHNFLLKHAVHASYDEVRVLIGETNPQEFVIHPLHRTLCGEQPCASEWNLWGGQVLAIP